MRELLVEQARRFLRHEGVRGAPRAEQRAFLEAKGLSEDEIVAAHAAAVGTSVEDSMSSGPTSATSRHTDCSSSQMEATARQKLSYLF
mmetsp:Transcript_19025/g.51724  ORF Transcript_19025/g.51724 Transcript_19025/m.51724 type:complete len:88 (+) Transcript_19025:55-318(+)